MPDFWIPDIYYCIWRIVILNMVYLRNAEIMELSWALEEYVMWSGKGFSDEYVKLFTKIPSNLKREKKSWELWLKSYTQPFFAILSLIWLLIMVLNHAIYTDMLNKENIIHHVGVVKIQQNENLKNNEDEKDDGFDYCDYYYNR